MNPNPLDRWNPGWQFLDNAPRAHAGGNRPLQAPPPANQAAAARQVFDRNNRPPRRIVPVPEQNRRLHRHHQAAQNQHRQRNQPVREERPPMTRDEYERINTVARKEYQTRTALEYDKNENQCWLNLLNELDADNSLLTASLMNGGSDFAIPSDEKILSNLRFENQQETILATRDTLLNMGATENELKTAVEKLEVHLRTNACEHNEIQSVSDDLCETVRQLTVGIEEIEDVLCQMENIRLF